MLEKKKAKNKKYSEQFISNIFKINIKCYNQNSVKNYYYIEKFKNFYI